MKKALIIGGGFAGLATAHQLALLKDPTPWDVTIIERGPFLGAGVRTTFLGGHPYTFGPRHFLTQRQDIWDFLSTHLPMKRHSHEFLTYIEQDEAFYNYPIHEDDIARMPDCTKIRDELKYTGWPPTNFEEFWISSVGQTLYNKFINEYSKKMWHLDSNTELNTFDWSPKGVTIKSGPRAGWDTAISGYPTPLDGYNSYFTIASANARVHLNTDFSSPIKQVSKDYDLVVSTIAPDTLSNYAFGKLPFISRQLTTIILPVEFALPKEVYFCYYAGKQPYTRVTEYKKFTGYHNPNQTLITIEYPTDKGPRLYPLPTASAQAKAKRYLSRLPKNVKSIGRAGRYDYRVDIDDCIGQAMNIIREL
jgi:UDP-galactopyranose mutase